MSAFLTLLAQLAPIAIQYGIPIVQSIRDAVNSILDGTDPTPDQFTALHALRDQIDAQRHAREAEAAS